METESRFKFNPKNHSYTLDGKRLTGVTTVLGVLDKPALIQWSANMAVDYIKANSIDFNRTDSLFTIDKEKLEEARKAWCIKRDSAGDIGSLVHKMIEIYVENKIKGNNLLLDILNLSKNELEKEGKTFEGIDEDLALKMFDKFIEWEINNNVKFLLSEQKLYSEKYWFAGTVDLVVEIKGKKYVADIKTARDIYNTNYIQMAGYHIMLDELDKIRDLEGYIVINIPKQLNTDGEVKLKEKRIHNCSDFKEAFLHCLALYRFINKKG